MSNIADGELQLGVNEEQRKSTPLPLLQLFITYLIQFAEPVTALVIYPFVNQLVRDTGITKGDETKTGYYAGVIESAFFLAECLSAFTWGYLSDRLGRKPVLLLGPLGLSISMLLFGLSTTFWPLVVLRCLQGSFNGNIGVAKTIIAEITDETNIGDAYAYIPIMWSAGTSIAPVIGGLLSRAAERWPDTFGRVPFFESYPYFLPCAVASVIAFLSFAIAFFALEETLESLVVHRKQTKQPHTADPETPLIDHSENVNYGTIGEIAGSPLVEASQCPGTTNTSRKSSSYTLLHRPLLLVFLNSIFLTFLSMADDVLLPLMYSTPLEYGGLGVSPFGIGIVLGTFGIINTIFQAKFMGPLMRYVGTQRLYAFGISSLCITFAMYPVMKYAARTARGVDGVVIVCIVIHRASIAPVYMAYGAIQVLIVESIPEGGLLGTANGFGQMLASGIRTVAPSLASSLFSISLQIKFADGNMVYYFLFGMSLLAMCLSWLLRGPTKTRMESGSHAAGVTTS